MDQLNLLYAKLLHCGFLVLRRALDSRNRDWIDLEFELLHNVPSLIGEENVERHTYFWLGERTLYIERVSTIAPEEAKSLMLACYKPIWDEMEPLVLQLMDPSHSLT